jgi:hypothetical protein
MRDGFVVHGAEGALGGAIGTLLVKRRIPITSGRPDEPAPSRAAPWAYSVALGSLLGVAITGLRVRTARRTLLAGAGMGAVVWALGERTARPVPRRSARSVAMSLAAHVLYGVAVSAPIALLEHERRRRQPWWERLAEDAGESTLGRRLGAMLRKVAKIA